jgi:hypothetical protein
MLYPDGIYIAPGIRADKPWAPDEKDAMIVEILHGARRLDAWVRLRLGRPYHLILNVGLVEEIVRHLRELGEVRDSAGGIIRILALVAFFALLLVHELGELHGHIERRRPAA